MDCVFCKSCLIRKDNNSFIYSCPNCKDVIFAGSYENHLYVAALSYKGVTIEWLLEKSELSLSKIDNPKTDIVPTVFFKTTMQAKHTPDFVKNAIDNIPE